MLAVLTFTTWLEMVAGLICGLGFLLFIVWFTADTCCPRCQRVAAADPEAKVSRLWTIKCPACGCRYHGITGKEQK